MIELWCLVKGEFNMVTVELSMTQPGRSVVMVLCRQARRNRIEDRASGHSICLRGSSATSEVSSNVPQGKQNDVRD